VKNKIYVETSVLSYLVARQSRDPIKAARQLQAKALWNAQDRFQLLISPTVIEEAQRGNSQQAQLRLQAAQVLQILPLSSEAAFLAQLLIERQALPKDAVADALHIAIATVNRIKVLASFNFKHLASVFARAKIEHTLRQLGYEPPLIASPQEIIGASND
jgi:predicted nucleic acid-binding protein